MFLPATNIKTNKRDFKKERNKTIQPLKYISRKPRKPRKPRK